MPVHNVPSPVRRVGVRSIFLSMDNNRDNDRRRYNNGILESSTSSVATTDESTESGCHSYSSCRTPPKEKQQYPRSNPQSIITANSTTNDGKNSKKKNGNSSGSGSGSGFGIPKINDKNDNVTTSTNSDKRYGISFPRRRSPTRNSRSILPLASTTDNNPDKDNQYQADQNSWYDGKSIVSGNSKGSKDFKVSKGSRRTNLASLSCLIPSTKPRRHGTIITDDSDFGNNDTNVIDACSGESGTRGSKGRPSLSMDNDMIRDGDGFVKNPPLSRNCSTMISPPPLRTATASPSALIFTTDRRTYPPPTSSLRQKDGVVSVDAIRLTTLPSSPAKGSTPPPSPKSLASPKSQLVSSPGRRGYSTFGGASTPPRKKSQLLSSLLGKNHSGNPSSPNNQPILDIPPTPPDVEGINVQNTHGRGSHRIASPLAIAAIRYPQAQGTPPRHTHHYNQQNQIPDASEGYWVGKEISAYSDVMGTLTTSSPYGHLPIQHAKPPKKNSSGGQNGKNKDGNNGDATTSGRVWLPPPPSTEQVRNLVQRSKSINDLPDMYLREKVDPVGNGDGSGGGDDEINNNKHKDSLNAETGKGESSQDGCTDNIDDNTTISTVPSEEVYRQLDDNPILSMGSCSSNDNIDNYICEDGYDDAGTRKGFAGSPSSPHIVTPPSDDSPNSRYSGAKGRIRKQSFDSMSRTAWSLAGLLSGSEMTAIPTTETTIMKGNLRATVSPESERSDKKMGLKAVGNDGKRQCQELEENDKDDSGVPNRIVEKKTVMEVGIQHNLLPPTPTPRKISLEPVPIVVLLLDVPSHSYELLEVRVVWSTMQVRKVVDEVEDCIEQTANSIYFEKMRKENKAASTAVLTRQKNGSLADGALSLPLLNVDEISNEKKSIVEDDDDGEGSDVDSCPNVPTMEDALIVTDDEDDNNKKGQLKSGGSWGGGCGPKRQYRGRRKNTRLKNDENIADDPNRCHRRRGSGSPGDSLQERCDKDKYRGLHDGDDSSQKSSNDGKSSQHRRAPSDDTDPTRDLSVQEDDVELLSHGSLDDDQDFNLGLHKVGKGVEGTENEEEIDNTGLFDPFQMNVIDLDDIEEGETALSMIELNMDQFDRLDAYHKAHSIREEEEKSMEKNEGSEEPNNNGGLPSTPQTRRRKQYMETSPLPPPAQLGRIKTWPTQYDGLIQCRSFLEGNPVTMINCFGLSKYEVKDYEIFVAKPSYLSSKETCTHAEELLDQLVECGMVLQNTLPSNKNKKQECAQKAGGDVPMILSPHAKSRITSDMKGDGQINTRFLTFDPPFQESLYGSKNTTNKESTMNIQMLQENKTTHNPQISPSKVSKKNSISSVLNLTLADQVIPVLSPSVSVSKSKLPKAPLVISFSDIKAAQSPQQSLGSTSNIKSTPRISTSKQHLIENYSNWQSDEDDISDNITSYSSGDDFLQGEKSDLVQPDSACAPNFKSSFSLSAESQCQSVDASLLSSINEDTTINTPISSDKFILDNITFSYRKKGKNERNIEDTLMSYSPNTIDDMSDNDDAHSELSEFPYLGDDCFVNMSQNVSKENQSQPIELPEAQPFLHCLPRPNFEPNWCDQADSKFGSKVTHIMNNSQKICSQQYLMSQSQSKSKRQTTTIMLGEKESSNAKLGSFNAVIAGEDDHELNGIFLKAPVKREHQESIIQQTSGKNEPINSNLSNNNSTCSGKKHIKEKKKFQFFGRGNKLISPRKSVKGSANKHLLRHSTYLGQTSSDD